MTKDVRIFEHIARRQVFPDGLLGPSKRHMEKVQNEELDVKHGIYVELLDTHAVIEGELNQRYPLTFHKVIDTTCLYFAEIPENGLNPYLNDVELTVSGQGYSQEEYYTFSARFDDIKVKAERMNAEEKARALKKWMEKHQEVILDVHTGDMKRNTIVFQPHLIYKDHTTQRVLVYGYRDGHIKPFSIDFTYFDRVDPENKLFDTVANWKDDYAFRDIQAENFFEEIFMIQ